MPKLRLNLKPRTTEPEAKPEAKAEPKPEAKAEPKPEAKAEPKPEAKAEPKPEAKAEPQPEAKAKTPSDLTPQIAKRAYELYEERGRRTVKQFRTGSRRSGRFGKMKPRPSLKPMQRQSRA